MAGVKLVKQNEASCAWIICQIFKVHWKICGLFCCVLTLVLPQCGFFVTVLDPQYQTRLNKSYLLVCPILSPSGKTDTQQKQLFHVLALICKTLCFLYLKMIKILPRIYLLPLSSEGRNAIALFILNERKRLNFKYVSASKSIHFLQ